MQSYNCMYVTFSKKIDKKNNIPFKFFDQKDFLCVSTDTMH